LLLTPSGPVVVGAAKADFSLELLDFLDLAPDLLLELSVDLLVGDATRRDGDLVTGKLLVVQRFSHGVSQLIEIQIELVERLAAWRATTCVGTGRLDISGQVFQVRVKLIGGRDCGLTLGEVAFAAPASAATPSATLGARPGRGSGVSQEAQFVFFLETWRVGLHLGA
jgi:hypothetical protein